MRTHRSLISLVLLLAVLPSPASAALRAEGAPLAIAGETACSFITDLEVTATPKGAFEVVWADDYDARLKGRRFLRNLQPTGSPIPLLPLHGGLEFFDFTGTWAGGRYELALNAMDFGTTPASPLAAYRLTLDVAGVPFDPPTRFKPTHFLRVAPASGGDSLQFRFEPPFFGTPSCQSQGLLARRVDAAGNPLFDENRITRRASPWSGHLGVDRLPDDTFVAAYGTCQDFNGVVARRLNAAGAPIGKPVNLPLPGRVGNFEGVNIAVAARGAADFAVAAMVSTSSLETRGMYTRAVVNGRASSPSHIPRALIVDLEASPAGGYLLLYYTRLVPANAQHLTLFAQELDAQGAPRGAPLAITGAEESGVNGAIANLPGGRWLVVARVQTGEDAACRERLVGTILSSE